MAANYRALPLIKIEDEDAPTEIMENILQVIVEQSLHSPGLFTLIIRNDYQPGGAKDAPWKQMEKLKIGNSVEIGFTPSQRQADSQSNGQQATEESLFYGEITSIETHFTEQTQAPIIVRGYDLSHRLYRGRFNRSFQNVTDTDLVKKIADEVDIELGTIDNSGEPHDYLFQENQTNMAFLRERAARIGFELFVQNKKLHFRQPKIDEELKLTWLKELRSFRVRLSSLEQVKAVEVRGWDYKAKQPLVAVADQASVLTERETDQDKTGNETSTAFKGMKETPRMVVVDQPMFKPKEADALAQTVCDEIEGQFVTADARAEGNPQLRPGIAITLEEMGPYTGKYYVTETRHGYAERVYSTDFAVRGLQGDDLFSPATSRQPLQPGYTHLVGIVTDNEDPEGMGRVRVKFPTLTEDHISNWARVVSIGAADGRGFDCLPEIDDEVLVAFEHGDIHRPYVLGGVWNGQDAPPNPVENDVQDGKVRLRTFQTRTGHKIQFIEEDKGGSKTGVLIQTKGGHKAYLDDSGSLVTITSTGTMNLDASGDMTIKAGGNMNIQAGPTMNLKAGMININ